MKQTFITLLVITASFLFSPLASATGPTIDVSGVVTFLNGDVATAINSVGGAILTLSGIAVGYKWVKAMIFG